MNENRILHHQIKKTMKFIKYLPLFFLVAIISCSKDDNRGGSSEPPREEDEVYEENQQEIETFLRTHYYTLETDAGTQNKRVVFDTIAGENEDKTPLKDDDALKSKTLKSDNVEYTIYYLQVRKGYEEEYQPTFADKVALSFQMRTFTGDVFSEAKTPRIIDMPQTNSSVITQGSIAGITEFKGASGFSENTDGTISYEDDYGIGAVFIPSGVAYFNNSPSMLLKPYEPFVMTFELYKAVQMDHDGDGIPSYLEDVNGNGFLNDDDTDQDGTPNYLDPDDDGDGVPTKDEIIIRKTDKDWLTPDDIDFIDSNNSGTPDYLDPSVDPNLDEGGKDG